MANLTVGNVLEGMKNPAIVGGGFLLGILAQKSINKMLNSETVVQGLGADTVLNLKNYATPFITAALGVGVSISSDNPIVKKLATGVAISGTVNAGMQFFWQKNLLSGLSGGMLGDIFGTDDDIDEQDGFTGYEDLDGYEEDDDSLGDLDDYDETPAISAGSATGTLDIPFTPPALRDTEYEKEPISGFGFGNDEII